MTLWIYLVAFVTIIVGALIDARLWGDRAHDPYWLTHPFSVLWLGGWNVLMPVMWAWIGVLTTWSWSVVALYAAIMFGMSVFWDLTYFRIEDGVWVRPIHAWFTLPWFGPNRRYNRFMDVVDKKLFIGFNTEHDMRVFNIVRTCILISTIIVVLTLW